MRYNKAASQPRGVGFAGSASRQVMEVVPVHVDGHGFRLRSTILIGGSVVQSPPPLPSVLWMRIYAYVPSGFARGQEPPDQKTVPSERVSCGNAVFSLRQYEICIFLLCSVNDGHTRFCCTNHLKLSTP